MRRTWPALILLAAVGLAAWVLSSASDSEPPEMPEIIEPLTRAAEAVERPVPVATPPVEDEGPSPAFAWGAKFFNDALQYVSRGRPSIAKVRDFHLRLDAKLELDTSTHEGNMSFWYGQPSRFRWDSSSQGATTTKILNGNQGWVRTPNGRVQSLAFTPEGQQTLKHLREDRTRLGGLVAFLTLQTMKGPGVTFRFDGYKTGSGTYAGTWMKITRLAPGQTNIVFWLAYERGPENDVTATWPGIVRIEGDPSKNHPTEDYILREWDSQHSQTRRSFRYPRRIEAYSILKDRQGRAAPTRFLFAIVDDLVINEGVEEAVFQIR